MKTASLLHEPDFNESRPALSVMLDTPYTKEVKIAFREGQIMKEHKAPHPIVVQTVKGEIDFEIEGQVVTLQEGDLITLDSHILHALTARKESIVRLSIHKGFKSV